MDEKIKFGIYSLLIILFQSILKIYGVIVTNSLTFLAETVDTLVDFVFVSILLYSLYHSEKPPDYQHMYGHSKIDPIGAMIQGVILINLYALIIMNAIQSVITKAYIINNPLIGLQLLIISFSVNLVFSRILMWQGKRRNSPSLRIQGLNLFQDSMRAIIALGSFIFALFDIIFLDPIFSIILSIYIIIGAIQLSKNGINNLTDINPINYLILEDIRQKIFNLDHVIGVRDLKIRASGNNLYLEAHLSVEDHISLIHANEITKSIRTMSKKFFQNYNVECIIEMNPLGGEKSIGENIRNLIYSMKAEYPEIIEVSDVNIFRIQSEYFLSLTMIVNDKLTLKEAHDLCTNYENELKTQSKNLARIITHIEAARISEELNPKPYICKPFESAEMKRITNKIVDILKAHPQVKGYHGFECWTILNSNVIEIHVFFDGALNISKIHEYTTDLEKKILDLNIENLKEVILHSEPLVGRTDGTIFNSIK